MRKLGSKGAALMALWLSTACPAATVQGPAVLEVAPAGLLLDLDLAISGDLYLELAGWTGAALSLSTDAAVFALAVPAPWPHAAAGISAVDDLEPLAVTGDAYVARQAGWADGTLTATVGGDIYVSGLDTAVVGTLSFDVGGGTGGAGSGSGGAGGSVDLTSGVGGGGSIDLTGGVGSGSLTTPLPPAVVLLAGALGLLRRRGVSRRRRPSPAACSRSARG